VNLELAWEKVKANKGAAGVDRVTIAQYSGRKDYYLDILHRKLQEGTYRSLPVRRVEIPKPDGGIRNLGIPAVMDRICQQALVQRMEPIFEPIFQDCSYGYRPGRSPHMAMRTVWQALQDGYEWVVDADLRQFFDTIDQDRLVDLIADEISDGRVLQLIRAILQSGVLAQGCWQPTLTGVPQGGVVSPLLSNIYLTPFDRAMTAAGYRMVRWADDFVVLCKTRQEAERAMVFSAGFLTKELGVALHPGKSRVVHVSQGFEFLGYKVKRGQGYRLPASMRCAQGNSGNLYAIPREKSVKRFRDQIRRLTRRRLPLTLVEVVDRINPVIRGWGTYYSKAHVRRLFHQLDGWIVRRLYSFLAKRWRNDMWRRYSTRRLIEEFGLVRLIQLIPGLIRR
jgi:group II intron reverse transcriptase/maturase